MIISPSLLSADFSNLGRDVRMLNESAAQWIHLDVMDGVFVPNISFGFPVISSIKDIATKPLDVHLMIVEPAKYVDEVKRCGAEYMTVHYEACSNVGHTIAQIKKAGMKAGISIKPGTPIEVLDDIIADVDLVLIMSVEPGFGGQKFIPASIDRVKHVRRLIDAQGLPTLIEVDGGVNEETGRQLAQAGADVLVAGSYVFKASSPKQVIEALVKIDF